MASIIVRGKEYKAKTLEDGSFPMLIFRRIWKSDIRLGKAREAWEGEQTIEEKKLPDVLDDDTKRKAYLDAWLYHCQLIFSVECPELGLEVLSEQEVEDVNDFFFDVVRTHLKSVGRWKEPSPDSGPKEESQSSQNIT